MEGNTRANPYLQIWRPFTSDPSKYRKVHQLPLLTSSGESQTVVQQNVYEYVLPESEHITTIPGDVLGIYLSRQTGNRDRLDIFFEMSSTSIVDYYIHDDNLSEFDTRGARVNRAQGLPLVAFEVLCDGMHGIYFGFKEHAIACFLSLYRTSTRGNYI